MVDGEHKEAGGRIGFGRSILHSATPGGGTTLAANLLPSLTGKIG
jgi:hypothetical protein